MDIVPKSLNIPFPPKDHWKAHILIAVVLVSVLFYGVSANFGKAYLAAVLAYLPGLALFIFGGGVFVRLRGGGDLRTIGFWLLVTAYMLLAKRVIFPFALTLLDGLLP